MRLRKLKSLLKYFQFLSMSSNDSNKLCTSLLIYDVVHMYLCGMREIKKAILHTTYDKIYPYK